MQPLDDMERNMIDLQHRVDLLEQRTVEADASLRSGLAAVQAELSEIRRHLQQQEDRWTERGLAVERTATRLEALEDQLERLEQSQARAVDQTSLVLRTVQSLAAHPSSQAPASPAIWQDPEGRRVLWWGVVAAVLCSLAIGGGLTSDQALQWGGRLLGVSAEGTP